jgi:thioredoxin 1
MKPIELTDANFPQEVEKSDVPVLVDFWAVWCGPCKMIAPVVEEIANEYSGKLKVGKVDVDNNPEISMKFGIRSIPTLMVFKGGKVVDQIIGAVPKKNLVEKLLPHMN